MRRRQASITKQIGSRQANVLRAARVSGGAFQAAKRSWDYTACLTLHGRGLLSRDSMDAYRFYLTRSGMDAIDAFDAAAVLSVAA